MAADGKEATWGQRPDPGVHLGHETLWSQDSNWYKGWLGAPLRLYKRMLYDPRPDLYSTYARGPQWTQVQHRARFWQALVCYLGPPGHMLWNLKWPLLCVIAVQVGYEIWGAMKRCCVPGLGDLDENGDTKLAFQLTSFAVSLLLALRLQQSYTKFMNARGALGSQINGVMSLIEQSLVWIPERALQWDIIRWSICMVFSFHHALRSETVLDPQAAALLAPDELALYSRSRKSRQICYMRLTQLITAAGLPWWQFQALHASLSKAWSEGSSASRIKYTPIPQAITLLSTGFTFIYCLLLPLGMWDTADDGSAAAIVKRLLITLMITILLLGIDEVAIQLDNPFCIMPWQDMTRVFWTDCHRNFNEIQELNGLPLPQVGPRSTEAAAGWQAPNGAATALPPGLHTPEPEPTVEVRYH